MAYTTINKSSDHFNTVLYTGSGSAQDITTGHQPDLIWIKNRGYADHHQLVDRVRWVSNSNSAQLSPNQTSAQGTKDIINSFSSTSYNLETGDRAYNSSDGDNFVSWSWKANGAGSANTDGSINTTATSVNTTAGFSISKYTGTGSNATVGHGLGTAPKWIIIKKTSGTEQWVIGESASGFTKNLHFLTAALNTSSAVWNDTAPTSTVFSVGTNSGTNSSGETYIAYCWSEIIGFSKFGSYVGNGNADGSFIYTGFKPAFVMLKYASPGGGVGNWGMHNAKVDVDNPVQKGLIANSNAVEDTHDFMDFFSNGFKLRSTSSNRNENGSTYVYMAFAEAPLVGSNNIPATAR